MQTKKELINNENTISNLSIILKKITSNTHNEFPSNKESGNELILENNTNLLIQKISGVHEMLDVEFEHLQRRSSTYLISRPINQSKQLAMTNAAMSLMLPKGKVIQSNIQNQKLNKVTAPLNKVPSCEEQLIEIR